MNNLDTSIRDQDPATDQKIQAFNQPGTTSLEVSKPKSQIRVLDGVRAVACLAVFSWHVNFLARNYGIWPPLHSTNRLIDILVYFGESLAYFGESGVILFFLLSSFLLFLPYAKSLLFDSPWPSLRRFYLRRIFRILPGFCIALFLIALFFHPEFLHRSHRQDLWLFLTFRMDFNLSNALNGPFWTLAIEFQFYLLLPIIGLFFRPLVRRGTVGRRMVKLTLCLLAMVAWGLLTRYWGLYLVNTPKLDFLIPHAVSTALKPFIFGDDGDTGKYFEVFAVGMLICMVYTYTQNSPWAEPWSAKLHCLSPLMFTIGLLLLSFLSFWHFYFSNAIFNFPEYNLAFSFLKPYTPKIVSRWPQWQAIAYAISYGFCFWALLYGSPRLKRLFEWS